MKILNYKYLFDKRKSSISFNNYYTSIIFDSFYKESLQTSASIALSKIVPSLYVHGGKQKNISWFKFFFLWLRNVIGLSFGIFRRKRLYFLKVYSCFSYGFFIYLDYFRFFLYPFFLQRFRILKKQSFSSTLGVVAQVHYLDYLSTNGSIFNKFFDMSFKAKFFSAYLKERPLYLDAVDYSAPLVISFFFNSDVDCFFSFFGFYSLDLNSFFLEKGNRFSYGLKII